MNFALCTVAGLVAGFLLGRGFARDQAAETRTVFRHACITDLQSVDECMRIFP